MWNITSNDVQQAKVQVQRRRAEVERRHAEESQALDAELAAIETLERAASAFALQRGPQDVAGAAAPPAEAGAPLALETSETGAVATAGPAAELDPPGGGEPGNSLDILKPGSRWRLYRGSRPPEPEEASDGAFPNAG